MLAPAFSTPALAAGEVNLYSYRQPFLIQPMLDAFTKETGVTVNVVAPGHTLTPVPPSLESMDDVARKGTAIPLKRHARPEEMGYAIAWLLGPESEFVTGQVLSPNGGFTIT